MKQQVIILFIIGIIVIFGNWIGYDVAPIEALPGMAIIVLIGIIGWGISKVIPLPIESPTVVWVSLLALLITSPIFPSNSFIAEATGKINFMAIATPVLAYAGLSLGKDFGRFKKLGWRIIMVSLVVFTGSFLFATLFAEIIFQFRGAFGH
ncbi:hypothetical protein ACI7RC_19695 [Brevibacillus sp. B_LB10_24]|uniref:hypothetical protein n=1 Tax=Brevibacillus sp. B_LB10_24 TaxID=3380645 RepID=UPI0038B8E94F